MNFNLIFYISLVIFVEFGPGGLAQVDDDNSKTETINPTSKMTDFESTSAMENFMTENSVKPKKDAKDISLKPTEQEPDTEDKSEDEEEDSGFLYKYSEQGKLCILLKVDALIMYTFTTIYNTKDEKDVFMPETATVSGDCQDSDSQKLILKWQSHVLWFFFSKTLGGERWYVEQIQYKFVAEDSLLEHAKSRDGRSIVGHYRRV